MQLIGMLDSPYVRRVAISLQLLGLPFEHRSISVSPAAGGRPRHDRPGGRHRCGRVALRPDDASRSRQLPEVVSAEKHPNLSALSAQAELLPEYMAAPHGSGTCHGTGQPFR